MFKKKSEELTVQDAPDSIAPWEMLDDAGIAAGTARLRQRYPFRDLTAIARRLDRDALACFDKGPNGTGKAVLVFDSLAEPNQTTERRYAGFGEWFDAALADAQK